MDSIKLRFKTWLWTQTVRVQILASSISTPVVKWLTCLCLSFLINNIRTLFYYFLMKSQGTYPLIYNSTAPHISKLLNIIYTMNFTFYMVLLILSHECPFPLFIKILTNFHGSVIGDPWRFSHLYNILNSSIIFCANNFSLFINYLICCILTDKCFYVFIQKKIKILCSNKLPQAW